MAGHDVPRTGGRDKERCVTGDESGHFVGHQLLQFRLVKRITAQALVKVAGARRRVAQQVGVVAGVQKVAIGLPRTGQNPYLDARKARQQPIRGQQGIFVTGQQAVGVTETCRQIGAIVDGICRPAVQGWQVMAALDQFACCSQV